MVGSKGCHDDFAAAIIYIFNAVAAALSILGLAGICYLWYTQTSSTAEDPVFNVFIPQFMALSGLCIFLLVLVLVIAKIGIVGTCVEMKANARDGGSKAKIVRKGRSNDKDEGNSKTCCHNRGLLYYIALSFFAFVLMMGVGIFAAVYSGKLDHINYVNNVQLESVIKEVTSQVKERGDPWILDMEHRVSNMVFTVGRDNPKSWNTTQTLMGCCGWNITAEAAAGKGLGDTNMPFNHADVLAYGKDTKCCEGKPVVVDPTVDTGIKLDDRNCWVTEDDTAVYTCQRMVARHVQGNVVKISICAIVFAFIQLALSIAGCVVRFPRVFRCCARCCGKKRKVKSRSAVAVEAEENTKDAGDDDKDNEDAGDDDKGETEK